MMPSILCSRCKKRIAVVFTAPMDGSAGFNGGLCLTCAKELGIKPVNNLMESMGISEDDLEEMNNQLMEYSQANETGETEEQTEGAESLFSFLQSQQNGQDKNQGESGATRVKEKKEQKPKRKFLTGFCEDLTAKARAGQLDAVIGRDKEIERVVQILSRRTKNNPCLIGEPGVGKTAIAEGIAIRIAKGQVPAKLMDKEVFLLDLTGLMAGTQFRGQFESRVKGLIDEIKAAGNIILVVDEAHNLVDAGSAEGSMNAGNMLKPALSRGEIQVIGATTFAEYRKYIEKDAALERRFQPVRVEEPSISDTVEILKGIKGYYERFHKLKVPDEMVRSIVVLSELYISDRFLPDKAIDLLDEACTCAALRCKALVEYEQAQQRLSLLKKEETDLENVGTEGKEVDYERLAQIRAETLQLQMKSDQVEKEALAAQVTEEDVAHVLQLWTGIPESKIKEKELQRVAHLGDLMKKKVIGQEEAINLVAAAVKRSRVQISPRRRPASFIFVGPTGVGKTELVKVLAAELFDSVEPLIRLDMSEFMEKHSVSRIIGSPPGYVGYDEAGQLTEKVRRKPYSVVLFDEIEKAHPDVMNILLQILDEGRITDAQGRTVNFENTVIVMTSNAGSNIKENALGFNKNAAELSKENCQKALSEFLRPEFLSRVDEIVVFSPLSQEHYAQIAGLMLEELVEPLKEKEITFTYDPAVLPLIAQKALGGKSGARDIRRIIRREVEDEMTNQLVDQCNHPPTQMKLVEKEGRIQLLSM